MKLLQESPNQKEFSSGEFLTYMWEVPGSNLAQETDYPHRDTIFSFPKFIKEYSVIANSIRSGAIYFTSFAIHCLPSSKHLTLHILCD